MKKQQTKQQQLNVRAFTVLERAVEAGVARGLRAAHKHTDTPDPEAVGQYIEREVMSAIGEVFDLEAP